jgi:cell division cycle 2-like protein
VLEFVEHDVKTILEEMDEPFMPSEVKRLLLQLVSGVEYLHDNWILHRDLKTSNLLLNNRGQLKIADFGMARFVGDPAPSLTQLVVTLWYRAPELLLGAAAYDGAVDMWSLGCVFAEMLTREPLLQGKNELDQLAKTFDLLGFPDEVAWPGFRKLPHARGMKLPRSSSGSGSGSGGSSSLPSPATVMRIKFPSLTRAGCDLLGGLLSLDPHRRPRAADMLVHDYFAEDPRPKPEAMFPTFPSKAGQERRRRCDEPHAPVRDDAAAAAEVRNLDFSGIFQGRSAGSIQRRMG